MIDFDVTVLAAALGAFGEPVTYRPSGEAAVCVPGIFEASLKELKPDQSGVLVEVEHPVLGLRASDLAWRRARNPMQGDVFVVRGQSYQAKYAPPPDGEGHLRVELMGPL